MTTKRASQMLPLKSKQVGGLEGLMNVGFKRPLLKLMYPFHGCGSVCYSGDKMKNFSSGKTSCDHCPFKDFNSSLSSRRGYKRERRSFP